MLAAPFLKNFFDSLTPPLIRLFDSQYINLGYWDDSTTTIADAQLKLVRLFGDFSKLAVDLDVIDVGCGTGEQDLYFVDQFGCRSILGINISPVQVAMALEKVKHHPKYSSTLEFQVDDAMNLGLRSGASCDRLLALECAQYFSKRRFFQGAHHVLRSGGYLCLADPICDRQFLTEQNLSSGLISSIQDSEFHRRYGERLQKIISVMSGRLSAYEGVSFDDVSVSYEKMIEMLVEEGFAIEETQDISESVYRFYPAFKKEILGILETESDDGQIDFYLAILNLAYSIFSAYSHGAARFYFIRAMKKP